MNRQQAWDLVCEYTQSPQLRRHMQAVEVAMRAYARHFGEDEEKWGLVGLLHDFDYERYLDSLSGQASLGINTGISSLADL